MFNKAYTSRQQLTGQLLRKSWIDVCNGIKSILKDVDIIKPVKILVDLIKSINPEYTIISDVGNHELWLSLAYYYSGINNRILYSNSFGSLGCSLPKAIGAYYATNKPVISFNGDQGFQFNLQELQFISNSKIPIKIVVINNQSSGMIKSKEQELYNGKYIHTTIDSGYYPPSVKDIAHAYKIPYKRIGIDDRDCGVLSFEETLHPEILEIKISENYSLIPTLPIGNPIQNMVPKLPDKMYSELNGL